MLPRYKPGMISLGTAALALPNDSFHDSPCWMFSCLMIGGVGARVALDTREVAIPVTSCKLGGEGPAFGIPMIKSGFSAWVDVISDIDRWQTQLAQILNVWCV